jgi:hypothetical protein
MPAIIFEAFEILANVKFSSAFSDVGDCQCVCAYLDLFAGQIDRAVPALIRDLLKSSSVSDRHDGYRRDAQKNYDPGNGEAPDKGVPAGGSWSRCLKWRGRYRNSRMQNRIERLPCGHALTPNEVVAGQLSGFAASAQFVQRENADGLPVLMQMIIHKKTALLDVKTLNLENVKSLNSNYDSQIYVGSNRAFKAGKVAEAART